ncbi:MAG: triose-phosphate isomerase [Candidatus Scalindua sp. AMX11]|nr:MAG: triose-phosphate isomerase [Candidatus Scalindua sp.]NOG82480.1 triose-phosphate isomerase [Planctomycetota bacterium]RZV93913.1 MAG: triose-phosphate isomerase [Candidatus Scalindua sp. SCAELEC01]TDE65534.1 MAG: triose-phosphate isomerase [Candidatus Scalindua sp. AMX11]GJQ58115.1 MAG: triosephosphate isomerase [Candidatus Scalindua sp.]
MRKFFIVGNWKMNLALKEAISLSSKLSHVVADVGGSVDVGVSPSFVYLRDICEALRDSAICVGAQNMCSEKSGAFTGEVSGAMLVDVGCSLVILGHSERRTIFHEPNSLINVKLHTAFFYDLHPILCVGESLEEREPNRTEEVVGCQLAESLKGVTGEQAKSLTIAYEPVWAIGTGKTATPDQANSVHSFIRTMLKDRFGETVAQGVRIQYGGSVNEKNASELLSQPEIDGALVGGASLNPESFSRIILEALKIEKSR